MNKEILPGISAVLDRFEGDKAVIRTDDGQTVIWPKEKLPEGAHEGSALKLTAYTDEALQKEREENAKAVLSDILKTEDEV